MKKITNLSLALMIMCLCSVFNLHAQFSGGGSGTASDPFQIKTADDLNNVRNYLGDSNANKHFRLMNDIDLTAFLQDSTEGWLPIGDSNTNYFTGYFHGGGHTINGLWIDRPTTDYVGLFGYVGIYSAPATIDSVGVSISENNIIGGDVTGGLIGCCSSYSTIIACHVTGGEVSNNNYADTYCGGLIGINSYGTITNCYATNNSFSSSSSNHAYCGGLIGYNLGTVSKCYASGNSSVYYTLYSYFDIPFAYTGGLIGLNSSGTVNNCYASGNSSAYSTNSNSSSCYYAYSGGFIGANPAGTVNNCYATGNSSVTDAFSAISGGFIGSNKGGKVNNCYAIGNSSASGSYSSFASSGGFVGSYLRYDGKISNCYAVGQVSSSYYKGAFAGEYYSSYNILSQCYYNSDINESMSGIGVVDDDTSGSNIIALGKSSTEMQMQSTFVNWDFSTIWAIKEGSSYPYFQWQDNNSLSGIQTIPANHNSIAVYPNPTRGIAFVECEKNMSIQVYSLSGSLILQSISQSDKSSIDLSAYPKGIYLVKAGNKYARVIKK